MNTWIAEQDRCTELALAHRVRASLVSDWFLLHRLLLPAPVGEIKR
jgi:hypothetical protein